MATLTDSQHERVARARAIVDDRIRPGADSIDRERRYPRENLDALADADLMGLLIPVEYGGAGGGLLDLALVAEEIAAGCASTAMCFLMHACGSALISAKATPAQADAWLRPAARGEAIATLAFSERGTGAHFYAPDMTVQRRNGSFVVSGEKHFVTSGGQATLYPLLVATDGAPGISAIVATDGLPGMRYTGTWDGIGMAGNSSIALGFENVEVPAANVLGAEGDGQELVFGVVAPTFLVGLAAVHTGIARAAHDAVASHAAGRDYSSGLSLAAVPTIQRGIGELGIDVESARQLTHAAATAADAGRPDALPLVMRAKVGATEAAMRGTASAMQIGGGQAYARKLSLERHWRDARAGSVMAPTNDVLKEWLGKLAVGLPLFDEEAA